MSNADLFRKRWRSGEAVESAPLEPHNGAQPCRVCGRTIEPGDHCLSRGWTIGHACLTCGWWKLDELVDGDGAIGKLGAAFVVAAKGIRPIDQWEISALKAAGILERDEQNRLRWTEVGKKLRAALLGKKG